MRITTKRGERLKRLAWRYANAWANVSWVGSLPPEERDGIYSAYTKARHALWDEIDRLTSVDLTPRAIREGD